MGDENPSERMRAMTFLQKLFVAPARAIVTEDVREEVPAVATSAGPEAEPPPPPTPQPASPVFLTPQALISFPGAALGINILWNVVAVLHKPTAQRAAVPIVIALLIGVVIWIISASAGMTRKDKFVGAVIAFINALWLGLNALGIDVIKPPAP